MSNLRHHVVYNPENVGVLSAPHGPETGQDHVHLDGPVPDTFDAGVLKQLIYPDDSYTPEGVYWADLPLGKQIAFNASIDHHESKKELGNIWTMMKADPLSPVGWYFRNAVLPGAGLGLEGQHGQGAPPYSEVMAQWTFRVSFAIPAVGTLWLVFYRTWKMPLASRTLDAAKKKVAVTGYDVQSLKFTFKYFGGRLIATAGAWYCNDVFFYGNKLFQGQFIAVLSPGNKSVLTGWLWNMVNIGISLCDYYLASFLIDNKFVGRKRMQQLGFLMDFILFVVPAFHYTYYADVKAHIGAFQTMYFLSSFFNQFGPNTTTFLVAAEVYPTAVRASAHGFSAAVGKLGALTAAVLYSYITTQQKFYVVPWFGLAGMLVTAIFLPDTTGLDLKEQERRFHYIRNGRISSYHGIAVHPHHLSLWERMRGVGKYYDPNADYLSKVRDLREEWTEKMKSEDDLGLTLKDMEDEYPSDVHEYFVRSTGLGRRSGGGQSEEW